LAAGPLPSSWRHYSAGFDVLGNATFLQMRIKGAVGAFSIDNLFLAANLTAGEEAALFTARGS